MLKLQESKKEMKEKGEGEFNVRNGCQLRGFEIPDWNSRTPFEEMV
jgi:hypothetical protein